MARIDSFLKLGTQQGLFRRAFGGRGSPHARACTAICCRSSSRDLRDTELEGYLGEIMSKSQIDHFGQGK